MAPRGEGCGKTQERMGLHSSSSLHFRQGLKQLDITGGNLAIQSAAGVLTSAPSCTSLCATVRSLLRSCSNPPALRASLRRRSASKPPSTIFSVSFFVLSPVPDSQTSSQDLY